MIVSRKSRIVGLIVVLAIVSILGYLYLPRYYFDAVSERLVSFSITGAYDGKNRSGIFWENGKYQVNGWTWRTLPAVQRTALVDAVRITDFAKIKFQGETCQLGSLHAPGVAARVYQRDSVVELDRCDFYVYAPAPELQPLIDLLQLLFVTK